MKTQFTITKAGDSVRIRAPYCSVNNDTYRNCGGSFDKSHAEWVFPNTPPTLKMLEELFGAESPLVMARVPESLVKAAGHEWFIGGYKLASRRGRDCGVGMPDGVQLEAGRWSSSGGSVKSPRVTGSDIVLGVVMRKAFAEREGLEIIATETTATPATNNPMANLTDAALESECVRRGVASVSALRYIATKAKTLAEWKLDPAGYNVSIGDLLELASRATDALRNMGDTP